MNKLLCVSQIIKIYIYIYRERKEEGAREIKN
jgi:hypothetical protein